MKTFWFQLLGLTIVICGATFLAFNYQYLKPVTSPFTKKPQPSPAASAAASNQKLSIKDATGNTKAELNIELADTADKRTKGLGYRQSLATDSGMLFLHDKTQKYTYWMKGMQFPLDILWISDETIADIITNIPPPITGQTDDTLERYTSTVDVNRVLEVNAGFVAKNNIQKGDKIVLETQ